MKKRALIELIQLAISPCPNDTFAFYDLIHHSQFSKQIELIIADIDELNTLLITEKADFCKGSFFAYAQKREQYSLLSSGSALGSGCGPLVISKKKQLTEQMKVAIPGELTTANLLFSLCFTQIKNKIVMPFDKIIEAVSSGQVDAGVIIHESRFTYQKMGLQKVKDLGEWWEETTKSLIPLGGIFANRQLPKPVVIAFYQALYFSILQAKNPHYEHRQEMLQFIGSHAQEMDKEIQEKHINTYVNDQTLTLDKKGIEAIERLLVAIESKKLASPSKRPLIL